MYEVVLREFTSGVGKLYLLHSTDNRQEAFAEALRRFPDFTAKTGEHLYVFNTRNSTIHNAWQAISDSGFSSPLVSGSLLRLQRERSMGWGERHA